MTAGGPKPSQGTGTSGKNGHGPHFTPTAGTSNGKKTTQLVAAASETTTALLGRSEASTNATSRQFALFQEDAPACDNCGAITVRNGNCYLCHNCGASMGCS